MKNSLKNKVNIEIIILVLLGLLSIGFITYLFIPREIEITVKSIEWEHIVETERYELVTRQDWDDYIPSDAKIVCYTRKKRGAGKSSWYDNWVYYTQEEWIPYKIYTSQGRKGDTDYWPEVYISEIVEPYPSLGNIRESNRKTNYYVIAEDGHKYATTSELYSDVQIGDTIKCKYIAATRSIKF